jgi:uncharacterized membrane protein YjgN (DUF898 family)
MGVLVVVTLGFGAFLIPLAYIVFGALMLAYTRSRLGNLVFNKTTLGEEGHFGSRLRMRKLALIYATNLLAIVFTLGLAIPWAVIRTARYRADCLAFASDRDLDAFMGDIARQVTATGEEMGEMFDVDLSL